MQLSYHKAAVLSIGSLRRQIRADLAYNHASPILSHASLFMPILFLRGERALSGFRIEKLLQKAAALRLPEAEIRSE